MLILGIKINKKYLISSAIVYRCYNMLFEFRTVSRCTLYATIIHKNHIKTYIWTRTYYHGKNKIVVCTIKIVRLTVHYNIAIGMAIIV